MFSYQQDPILKVSTRFQQTWINDPNEHLLKMVQALWQSSAASQPAVLFTRKCLENNLFFRLANYKLDQGANWASSHSRSDV